MPKPAQRVRLESGLKLDINRLSRRGLIPQPGSRSILHSSWSDSYTGERLANATIRVERQAECRAACAIEISGRVQQVFLEILPRFYGGGQWYFLCPVTNRRASVLWMPPGATAFASRQRWGRQVAYASQFSDRTDRAHRGQARINSRLCAVGGFDPNEWDFPPKPKWMRWQTYRHFEERFDAYERQLDEGIEALVLKLGSLK